MNDKSLKNIRLTYKQRTWVMAYLLIGTPHDQDDAFCNLLMNLLSQPAEDDPDVERWERLTIDKGKKR